MTASTRSTTQMGLQAKHSFMMSLFIMNLGFASAMTDITAETVRISTHSAGRKPPMAPRDDVGKDLDHDGPFAGSILHRDHKQDDTSDRRDNKTWLSVLRYFLVSILSLLLQICDLAGKPPLQPLPSR